MSGPQQPKIISAPLPSLSDVPQVTISAQDNRLKGNVPSGGALAPAPLGPIDKLVGDFVGTGLNTIFRPNNGQTKFPIPVNPPPPQRPNETLLELNLMKELLSFAKPLGDVPNRGMNKQLDLMLNGRAYQQTIWAVTNVDTGKGDGKEETIHFEPGLFMHVPKADAPNMPAASICRMGSIPHGTTVHAQGKYTPIDGAPNISKVDIRPFPIGGGGRIGFDSLDVKRNDQARLPQDLTKFVAAKTITQEILNDPNVVLRNAIQGQTIVRHIECKMSTTPQEQFQLGGGTANSDFLEAPSGDPNAHASKMDCTYWIETVKSTITIPAGKKGDTFKCPIPPANPGAQLGPLFIGTLPNDFPQSRTLDVGWTQIQYSQNVLLDFGTLSWPHVSVATLVPQQPITIPADSLVKCNAS